MAKKTVAQLEQELQASQQKVRDLEEQLQRARAPQRGYGGSGAGPQPSAIKMPKTE